MAEAMEREQPKMVPTLGLTGVTVNAVALIAPGAFFWITFVIQAGYIYPSGMAMWAGICFAILLAYATAVSYSELAKLYPGAAVPIFLRSKPFLARLEPIDSRASRSLRSAGHLIFTTGSIRA